MGGRYLNMKKGALSGITVVDLTRVLAGPYCSMFLADMGANVIKVEIPNKGDDTRAYVPSYSGESAYFINLNRNKRSITLNLKSEKGKNILKEMVKKADIVLENFRPGTMDRLNLGYDVLKEINPGIIYGCISGFGHYGPYKERPGYDIIAQAMGGMMSTTGWPDSGPTRCGTAIGDVLAGLSLAIGVLSAHINKVKTGEGQKVDVALVDSVVSSLEIINQIYLAENRIPERIGNRYEAVYPYDSFAAKDGEIVIGAGNDKLFSLLANLMKQPELVNDERFLSNPLRVKNHALLKPIIEDWLSEITMEEAVEMMLNVGVPAAPIYTIDKVVTDPHIADAREMFVNLEHPLAGDMKICGNQIKLSNTPVNFERPAPLLGQHTHEILKEILNIEEDEYNTLKKEGVL
jgi:crotonobetainyl-CoA:carnitine CoA-transferase CaiB-like acyl-CoA transferase